MLTKATEDQRLIVVMDDLDRLTPDELLMVFELMRLVGDVPTITYLLAYDETTLNSAEVRHPYLPLQGSISLL